MLVIKINLKTNDKKNEDRIKWILGSIGRGEPTRDALSREFNKRKNAQRQR